MRNFLTALGLFILPLVGYSQISPLDHDLERRFGAKVYDLGSKFHSSIHPYYQAELGSMDSLYRADSLPDLFNNSNTWLYRKLFSEHLVQVEEDDYAIYFDFLPDFQIGREFGDSRTTWLNTRGFVLQGKVGDNFTFYSDFYENQGVFPGYLDAFTRKHDVVPGQGKPKINDEVFDFAYASGYLQYAPSKYVDFQLGYGKQFIGDGYRSMLLSDIGFNYPYFKVTATLGPLRYMISWAQFQDLQAPKLSQNTGNRKKWGVFHYLDWNITERLSVGLFESIIWQDADSTGNKRGFDFQYLNPVIFFRPVEFSVGSPDNALVGINAKYELFEKSAVYGQLMLDEFKAKEVFGGDGWWANKFGVQLGFKTFDVFKINKLNWMIEFNTARPYTYSQKVSLLNYGHYNQPLAHPQGANFRELLSIADYSWRRWQFRGQLLYAQYGDDPDGDFNYGKDIFKSYNTRESDYGNELLQGQKTNLYYGDLRVGYLLNPKNNLRLETGLTLRREYGETASWLRIGLRASFRNLYYDY